MLDKLRIDKLTNVVNKTANHIKVNKCSLRTRKSSDKTDIGPDIGNKVPSGTPSGKGLYLTVYPSSCHDMDKANCWLDKDKMSQTVRNNWNCF